MPYPLSPEIHQSIAATLKRAFKDLSFYDRLVADKVAKILSDTDKVEIDIRTAKKLTERYFDVEEFKKTDQGKIILTQLDIIVRCAYTLILSHYPHHEHLKYHDLETLLEHYPQFQDQDEKEQRYLLEFRNMLKLALLIIPARLNKKLLINIAARLEGSGNEYITGGGQKPCVTRRCVIYEQEGGITPERLEEPRHRHPVAANPIPATADPVLAAALAASASAAAAAIQPPPATIKRKRPALNPSSKKLRLIRLGSDEIRAYTRTASSHSHHSNQGQVQCQHSQSRVNSTSSSSSSVIHPDMFNSNGNGFFSSHLSSHHTYTSHGHSHGHGQGHSHQQQLGHAAFEPLSLVSSLASQVQLQPSLAMLPPFYSLSSTHILPLGIGASGHMGNLLSSSAAAADTNHGQQQQQSLSRAATLLDTLPLSLQPPHALLRPNSGGGGSSSAAVPPEAGSSSNGGGLQQLETPCLSRLPSDILAFAADSLSPTVAGQGGGGGGGTGTGSLWDEMMLPATTTQTMQPLAFSYPQQFGWAAVQLPIVSAVRSHSNGSQSHHNSGQQSLGGPQPDPPAFGFPPNCLSRQQSEWLTSLMHNLEQQEAAEEEQQAGQGRGGGGGGGGGSMTYQPLAQQQQQRLEEMQDVLIPTLREISWDVSTGSFVEDFRRYQD